jgi:hypothetical protein
MPRESVLKYGEIQLISSGESVEKLMEHLDTLLKKHGYPSKSLSDADLKDLDDMMEEDEDGMDEQEKGDAAGADASTDTSSEPGAPENGSSPGQDFEMAQFGG